MIYNEPVLLHLCSISLDIRKVALDIHMEFLYLGPSCADYPKNGD